MTRRLYIILPLLLCLATGLTLAACGKKPSEVVLSDDGPTDAFPRTYPDAGTDPAGTYPHEK